ncbi:hypothetical protein VKT23_009464 [Stygiomarasmius scandens]|uniref:Uncharacterized protein n=1 Tax=Marasmiellus scandens TaxID=2682957 RepID=A0ABR1JET1_9AGAR
MWQCVDGIYRSANSTVFDVMNHSFTPDQLTAQRCIDSFASNPNSNVEDLVKALKEVLQVNSIPESFQSQIDNAVARKSESNVRSQDSTRLSAHNVAEESPYEQAFQYLLSFSHSESTTIPEAEQELLRILQVETLPQQWLVAIGKAVLEPSVDVEVALQALNAMRNDLVPSARSAAIPSSLIAPRDQSSSTHCPNSPSWTARDGLETQSSNSYPVFSTFSVPDVPGAVYLEACLGLDPQNTPIVEFLRQHLATLKVGNVRLDPNSNRHHQRLWLQPVPVPEVGELLNISPPSIKLFTWVKVTHGRYKNDVGFVIRRQISTANRRLAVLLVPRLETEPLIPPSPAPGESKKSHGKRKRQECERLQRLFARTEWKEGKQPTYRIGQTFYAFPLFTEFFYSVSFTYARNYRNA